LAYGLIVPLPPFTSVILPARLSIQEKGKLAMSKLLLVEDHAELRKAMKSLLSSSFPSICIEEATEGDEALRKVENFRPDLILMDIELPGKSGLVITKEAKDLYPETVIVILSNYDSPEYREAAHRKGADYFLSKESTRARDIVSLVESIFVN
jgi:DNA-binding NarL/FixJ family response regulator